MAKTHEVLVKPAPGTQVAPVHSYDDEQKAKLLALKEVRTQLNDIRPSTFNKLHMNSKVCVEHSTHGIRSLPQVGAAMDKQAGHGHTVYARS